MIKTSVYGVDRIQKIISGLKNLSRDGAEDDHEEVLIQATLLSSDDAPIVDQIINFQSTSGNLSVT